MSIFDAINKAAGRNENKNMVAVQPSTKFAMTLATLLRTLNDLVNEKDNDGCDALDVFNECSDEVITMARDLRDNIGTISRRANELLGKVTASNAHYYGTL